MNDLSKPMRAVRLTLKLDADDMRELSYALRTLADHAERNELTTGVMGGAYSGYIYELLVDPTITHNSYHAALREYLDGLKSQPAEPVQRKPLTEEEMRELWSQYGYKSALCMRFARAIEQAHGIKDAK